MNKLLLFVGLLLFANPYCSAQNTSGTVPYWVSVMDNDSTANYFLAKESFNKYWEDKELPMENDEYMDEERREKKLKRNKEISPDSYREHEKEEHEREEKFALQEHLYDTEFKRFMRWKDDMFVFVREDGSIPSMEERLRIINGQR